MKRLVDMRVGSLVAVLVAAAVLTGCQSFGYGPGPFRTAAHEAGPGADPYDGLPGFVALDELGPPAKAPIPKVGGAGKDPGAQQGKAGEAR